MIGTPFNDVPCLGAISEIGATMVAEQNPVLLELARQHPTIPKLIDYLRSLPQRDDVADPEDGPRVHECIPDQRVRIAEELFDSEEGPDPNCVERAIVFVSVAELIAPQHTYQLATVDTPIGLHTFPLMDGKAIVLDPRVTQDCLNCGVALNTPGPVGIEPRNAIAWVVDMATQDLGQLRNGPSQLYLGKNAIRRLIDEGEVPARREVDAMGFLFALAERAAGRYGARAIGIVRTVTRALADVLDAVLARRNAHINLGGLKFDTPNWLDDTAGALSHVGVDVGSAVLRHKLDALDLAGLVGLSGGTAGILGLLESELGKKGRTMGSLAQPPELATFAKFAASRTA